MIPESAKSGCQPIRVERIIPIWKQSGLANEIQLCTLRQEGYNVKRKGDGIQLMSWKKEKNKGSLKKMREVRKKAI